jgi:hypothetical protein
LILQNLSDVVERVAKTMIDKVTRYQNKKEKIIFFFEGTTLNKPGKKKDSDNRVRKRAMDLNRGIKGKYISKYSIWCRDAEDAQRLIARRTKRSDWWFTVLVADRLKSRLLSFCIVFIFIGEGYTSYFGT